MTTSTLRLPGKPRPWMNRVVSAMLRTPGVRSVLGKTLATITVTGSATGTRYTTPIQYIVIDGAYVVLSQRHRRWWRNLASRPGAELRIKGRTIPVLGELAGDERAVQLLSRVLTDDRRIARFYRVSLDEDGTPDPQQVNELAALVVVLVFTAPSDQS